MEITIEVEPGSVFKDAKRALVVLALEKYDGCPVKTATWLGMTIPTFKSYVVKYGLGSSVKRQKVGPHPKTDLYSRVVNMRTHGDSIKKIAQKMELTTSRVSQIIRIEKEKLLK